MYTGNGAIIIFIAVFLLFPSPLGWRVSEGARTFSGNEASLGFSQRTLPRPDPSLKLGSEATLILINHGEVWRVRLPLKLSFPVSYFTFSKIWTKRKMARSECQTLVFWSRLVVT